MTEAILQSLQTRVSRRDLLAKGVAVGAGAGLFQAAFPFMNSSLAKISDVATRLDISSFQDAPSQVTSLEGAIGEMQDRSKTDASDPKGWTRNARAHLDYCATPASDGPNQIHFCWWFLSWHRAYILVTERKLREISGDKAIAFPYWNWSTDRTIPKSFTRAGSPLSAAKRAGPNRGLLDTEVDFFPNDPVRAKFGVAALEAELFEASSEDKIGLSFGGIARPNSGNGYGNNRIEGTPHGPVHVFVGGRTGDMSDFARAALDPIFFSHHANLDRLWEIWRQDKKRKGSEPKTDLFLKHEFPFTWLDGSTITVSVEETLDTRKLGYVYDSLDVFRPVLTAMQVSDKDKETSIPPIAVGNVSVPSVTTGKATKPQAYQLHIDGVIVADEPMTVGVYVKAAADGGSVPGEPVGAFAVVLSGGRAQLSERDLQFDITSAIKKIGSSDLKISLVPYPLGETPTSYPPLKYQSMRIEVDN